MTEDPIVQEGTPVLHAKAHPVAPEEISSPKIRALIARMKELLHKEEFGVGLAAPQVGEPLRIFIVSGRAFLPDEEEEEEGEEKKEKPVPPDMVFINPELVRVSRTQKEMAEGCLSVRGKYGTVMRHEKATVRAQDEHGKTFTYHGTELLAHIFQHEMDHLEGILYIDKAEKVEDEEERGHLRDEFPAGKKQKMSHE
jgi:peptide deformylase